jgi:hypothetical protein
VAVSGSKLWRIQFRSEGRRSMKARGRWPEVSLKEAREKAAFFRKRLADGVDLTELSQEKMFREVAREWAGQFLLSLSARIAQREQGFLDKMTFPPPMALSGDSGKGGRSENPA